MKRDTKEKIGQFAGRTEAEQTRFFRGINVGMVIMALTAVGFKAADTIFDDGLDRPVPVERVVDVDAENLDKLELDKGMLVYNDTEDKYLVFVDDTESSPAQKAGWYEIDMNNIIAQEGE